MGFKLRLKNVQQGSGKASPFKINDSLVMGAGVAAKSFSNLGSGYNQGLNQTIPQVDESGDDTGGSEVAAKKPTCAETGLTGKALETCQENVNKDFLENDKKRIEAEAKAKEEQACKDEGFKNCAAKERGDKGFLKGIFNTKDKNEEVLDKDPLPASNTANE
tara:strand:+ start:1119 stop:1604 length:486 start_codon:yes stop_codon:yes gene_type:complete